MRNATPTSYKYMTWQSLARRAAQQMRAANEAHDIKMQLLFEGAARHYLGLHLHDGSAGTAVPK